MHAFPAAEIELPSFKEPPNEQDPTKFTEDITESPPPVTIFLAIEVLDPNQASDRADVFPPRTTRSVTEISSPILPAPDIERSHFPTIGLVMDSPPEKVPD
jgi:hypothetical protein